MDFKELIKIRQSDRKYEDRAVEREKLEQALEAGRLAPSANNAQGWTFVVADGESKKQLNEAMYRMGGSFAAQAPVAIALVAEKPIFAQRLGSLIRKIDFASLDMGIAAAHICLQAADLGLGTCMIESFDEKKAKKILNIPENRRIALLIPFGYSADKQRDKKRKEFNKIVKWNKYNNE
ncbi:MAG: nitroreductase family protein [Dysgonamonadaceae bacterium]|jgi:nitroreductase|nr:nitroreductase family protein [Dysgonamonadaceae bacterium]